MRPCAAVAFQPETAVWGSLSWIALGLFVGATGKSAQFPLYVWLPDAMEGPTPVSALIHAATMVTAGVYMVARSAALFQLTPQVLTIVASVGAFTAIFAATIGLVQNDIKRVLAYSTVSQLGYMFLALGVGAYWVAVFHLFTHAFFKALLFLGSGSVIHAMSGEQDMRRMGALKDKIPITHWTMWVGSVAIAGIPGLAGFFSKDEILWQAYSSPQGSKVLWLVGLVTAGLTAFYMWRLMNMTFYGKSRVAPEVAAHIHESPPSMWVPLVTLAVGSVFAGWLGVPKLWALGERFQAFEHWLEPAFASAAVEAAKEGAHDASTEWILMAVSVAVAIIGIVIARWFYHRKPRNPGRHPRAVSARSTGCSTTSITWTRSTISCSSTAWRRAAATCWARSTATWWMAGSTAPAGSPVSLRKSPCGGTPGSSMARCAWVLSASSCSHTRSAWCRAAACNLTRCL